METMQDGRPFVPFLPCLSVIFLKHCHCRHAVTISNRPWTNIVADPERLSRILDPNFFHPGSQIRIKKSKYFNPKNGFYALGNMIRVVEQPGSGSWFLPIPDPGKKGTGSRIRIRNTGNKTKFLPYFWSWYWHRDVWGVSWPPPDDCWRRPCEGPEHRPCQQCSRPHPDAREDAEQPRKR